MRVNLRDLAAAAEHDPADALLEALGDLSDYEPFHNLVLIATYMPPEKIGSIIVTDRSLEENRFQGKSGLVLKWGPTAFKDDSATKFGGTKVACGDWIVFRPSDAWEVFFRDRRKTNEGISVRFIEDIFIKGRVKDPSLIY